MEMSYECPICHKKYAVITDMANCIIADEKKRKEDSRIKELTEVENTIKETYEKLRSAVNKYNRLSDSKTYACTLTSSGQPTRSDFNSTPPMGKCNCGEKCKSKDNVDSFTLDIDENVIKELSERIANGDIFKLFSGI